MFRFLAGCRPNPAVRCDASSGFLSMAALTLTRVRMRQHLKTVLFCLAAICLAPSLGLGQPALPARMDRVGPVSIEKRAELKRQLDQHARVLDAQSAVVKIVSKLVGPAVVYIEADVPQRKAGKQIEEAGSGVIVTLKAKQYVLTNRHVIASARPEGIHINLADGRRLTPQKVWDDAESDVAIMLIDAPEVAAADLGDSDKVETGDFVLAIGSPFGLTSSVTFGIISAKGRRDLRFGESGETAVRFQDFMQTDAAINPGNSGGPLVNLRGEIIGMSTAIASKSGRNEGIGFAIPINMFMYVARQLVEKGAVSRAYMGVSLNSKFGPALAAELGLPGLMGAHVSGVSKGSPAEAARLAAGDVILRYNNTAIEDDAHLVNLVSVTDVGTRVPLVVFRDRQTFTTEVLVADRGKN